MFAKRGVGEEAGEFEKKQKDASDSLTRRDLKTCKQMLRRHPCLEPDLTILNLLAT